MRKLVIITMLILFSLMAVIPVSAQNDVADNNNSVTLTDEQKSVLKELNEDILAKKKELITKYVEFGVFDKKKGDMIIAKIEERFAKLEKDGFIPKWDKRTHKD